MLLTTIEIILLSCLGLFFLLQLLYFLCYLWKPIRHNKAIEKGKIIPDTACPEVSVIICAQNESENLSKFLPSVLEQDYPIYEVIVVNEGSSDESEEVLGAMEIKYKHLYRTYIPEDAKLSKKKLATAIGIKAAKYNTLLFTGADCKPASKDWIRLMVRHFNEKTSIVLGYGAFPKAMGFISKLAVYDNLINGLRSISMALYKNPYTGCGRNLAYKKSLFTGGNGFQKHLNLQSGEDDLFINEEANSRNTQVEISPASVTWMSFCDFRMWKEVKIKQITTRNHYHKKRAGILWQMEGLSRIGFWTFAIACIVLFIPQIIIPSVAGFLILLRWFLQGLTINKASEKLQGGEKFYWSVPFIDLILPFFNLYFRIYHVFRRKSDYTWRVK